MESRQVLIDIKNRGLFTHSEDLHTFVEGLCKRFSRVYKEILPVSDYDYIVAKLKEKGEI